MFRSQFALSLSLYKIGCTSDIEARLQPDLHITLNISNYMNINILHSVDKGKNHLHTCMHLSTLTSKYGRSNACAKTVTPTARYGIGRTFFLSEQPEVRAPYAAMCSRHNTCTPAPMLISASKVNSADKCK